MNTNRESNISNECKNLIGPMTIGLDLGDKSTSYCVLNTEGNVAAQGKITTTPAAFQSQFEGIARCRVALEVGTHSRWASRIIGNLGHEVVVANPQKVRLIAESDRKTDTLDARTLARLARVDPALLSPISHRAQETYPDLAKLRARELLVRTRTKLINAVRGIVKATGARLGTCTTRTFAKKMADELPQELQQSLRPLIDTIAHVNEQIALYDKEIEVVAKRDYPETQKLRVVHGVGPVTALQFVLTIGEPGRFAKSRQVGSFLGLQPRQSQSGDRCPQLGITKAGDSSLRQMLVQCSQFILGRFGRDCNLRRWGQSLMSRGGKNAKKRAVVAVARKLAVLLHALLMSDKPYDPFYKESVIAA
ncbi:MAG TPA: IS110 family transposase [Bryobacteraceae bacterium]|jgi:transposase